MTRIQASEAPSEEADNVVLIGEVDGVKKGKATGPWSKEDWDREGYNANNGKVRALFRWEGSKPGEIFHPSTGQIVPVLSFERPHARAFHFAWMNFLVCFIMWFAIAPVMPTMKKPKCAASDRYFLHICRRYTYSPTCTNLYT
jgi:hypothetical protein